MIRAMPPWIPAGVLFFAYVCVLAAAMARAGRRRRLYAVATALAGLVLCVLARRAGDHPVLADWILPPLVLLVGYWSSGLLFVAPMPRAERVLLRIDALLGVDAIARATPRALAEVLEAAYVGVYPLVPMALAIHLFAVPSPSADTFWTVILVTDFICFAFLPWVQTRPPRAFLREPPWASRVRHFNVRLLGATSIQANTFPSGHAAEALASALLLAGAPWPCVAAVGLAAFLVTAGTVLGRYHYAADALAGWVVAAGVWILM
jgi:hypothetical protein